MSLLQAFSSIVLKNVSAKIDNLIFHLHYRLTAVFLAAAAILVTSAEHFGKPITCGPAPPSLSEGLLENYCWTRSTFSMVEPRKNGVSPYPGIETVKKGDTIFYHTYYQWVWLVLSLQAAMFYLPHYLWKKVEGGKIGVLSSGLQDPIGDNETRETQRASVVKYISNTWNQRNKWAITYFACEFLNFVNVIAQMYIIDSFLGGTFTEYGSRVLRYGFLEQEDRTDSMVVIFPRLTKCAFRAYGPSGNLQIHDAICVLPLNIINEKIYVILWFWLVFLTIPSGIVLLYRLLLICVPRFRMVMLKFVFSHVNYENINHIMRRAPIGDWLLLNLLGKNLDPQVFERLITDLELEKLTSFNSLKK